MSKPTVDKEAIKALFDKHGFDFDAFEYENEFSAKAILDAMESYSTELRKENEELKDGLNKAVEVIKQWHNRDEVWDIYFNNAPEMNPVKQLINKNHVSK